MINGALQCFELRSIQQGGGIVNNNLTGCWWIWLWSVW